MTKPANNPTCSACDQLSGGKDSDNYCQTCDRLYCREHQTTEDKRVAAGVDTEATFYYCPQGHTIRIW